jgi:hypothetical protein
MPFASSFPAVVEARNFGRAAGRPGIGAATLTPSIQEFEARPVSILGLRSSNSRAVKASTM